MERTITKRSVAVALVAMLACLCALAVATPKIAHADELAAGTPRTQSNGSNMPLNGTVKGVVSDGETHEYYLKVKKTSEFTYSLKHNYGGDIVVYVITPSGGYWCHETMQILGSNTHRTSMSYTFVLRPGVYTISIGEGAVNGAGDTTKYTMKTACKTLKETYPETTSRNNDSRNSASKLAIGKKVWGVIDDVDLSDRCGDVYKLKLNRPMKLYMKFLSIDSTSPYVTITDRKGTQHDVDKVPAGISYGVVQYRPVDNSANPAAGVKSGSVYTYTLDKGVYYLTVFGNRKGNLGTYRFTTWAKKLPDKIFTNPSKVTRVTAAKVGKTSIKLKWKKQASATYQIRYKLKGSTDSWSITSKSNTKVIKGLRNNTKYVFKVSAYRNGKWGPWSAAKTVKTKS